VPERHYSTSCTKWRQISQLTLYLPITPYFVGNGCFVQSAALARGNMQQYRVMPHGLTTTALAFGERAAKIGVEIERARV